MERANLVTAGLLVVCGLALIVGIVRLGLQSAPQSATPTADTSGLMDGWWPGHSRDSRAGVGVVELSGEIGFGSENVGPFESLSATDKALRSLRELQDSDKVRAIVLRINSPGGSLAASQELHDAVRRSVDAGKPVVVSMGDLAASGGYYVAAAASRIVAQPGTITGSIGVITTGLNLKGLMDQHGVKVNAYTSGANKDLLAYWRDPRPDEAALLQGIVDEAYEQFLRAVAERRQIPEAELRPIADGRILLGSQAKEARLVDELGSFRDAVRVAAELGGLDDAEPRLIHPGDNLLDRLQLNLGARLGLVPPAAAAGASLLTPAWPVAYLYRPAAGLLPLGEVLR